MANVCREIGLIEQVDQRMKAKGRKASCGQAVQALVLTAVVAVGRSVDLAWGPEKAKA